MRTSNRFYLFLLVASAIGLTTGLAWASRASLGRAYSPDSRNMRKQEQKKSPKDPCWFMTLKEGGEWTSEMYSKRQEREMRGYPADLPLAEAIRVFNEEKQCNPTLAPYPPLTEDELIASIVAGPAYGAWGKPWITQKDTLFKIAKDKVMPKGSLIVATGGPNVQESPLRPNGDIKSRGISIAIFLGLENHEYGQDLKREQIFEIRRTYFSVDTIK